MTTNNTNNTNNPNNDLSEDVEVKGDRNHPIFGHFIMSDELATFLNKPIGTTMYRIDAAREIKDYIRTNHLETAIDNDNDIGKFKPDSKLSTLLKINPDDELTYFYMQRYLSCHFIKTEQQLINDKERLAKQREEFALRTTLKRETEVIRLRTEREQNEKQREDNEFKLRLRQEEAAEQKEARYLQYKKLHQSTPISYESQIENDLFTLIYK